MGTPLEGAKSITYTAENQINDVEHRLQKLIHTAKGKMNSQIKAVRERVMEMNTGSNIPTFGC